MERLTVKGPSGLISLKDKSENGANQAIKCLSEYEDTGLTPPEIMELKERDTEKAPEIHKNKRSSVYTCPSCNLVLINKDEKGWFCGKHYKFCPDCGQRIKWED